MEVGDINSAESVLRTAIGARLTCYTERPLLQLDREKRRFRQNRCDTCILPQKPQQLPRDSEFDKPASGHGSQTCKRIACRVPWS